MKRLLLSFLLCAGAAAQYAAYESYTAQIEALQRDAADITQKLGRDALIQRYRDLINAHPGYANNIRLETQIAMIYESDFSDQGLPPDYAAASEVYQNIIATYDPENPYMMTVRKLAADRAAESNPELAQQMYEGIITDYPEQDALVVQSEFALGKLAESQGDTVAAEKHYAQVMAYAPSGAKVSQAESENIGAYQANAAASMLTSAIKGHDSPQDRLKALKKFLEKHKDLERAQADLVHRFANAIERSGGGVAHDNQEQNATIDAMLASLKKDKQGDGAGRRDRTRTREQRTKDAEAEKTRLARAESTMDAAIVDSGATADSAQRDAKAAQRDAATREMGSKRALYTVAAVIGVSLIAVAARVLAKRRAR